jgi:hypothetical protein
MKQPIWTIGTMFLIIKGCVLLVFVPDLDTVTGVVGCLCIAFLLVCLGLLQGEESRG